MNLIQLGAAGAALVLVSLTAPPQAAAQGAPSKMTELPSGLKYTDANVGAGAEATRSMEPSVGRAAWLTERSRGQMDAGAYLIAVILRAWATRLSQAQAPSA